MQHLRCKCGKATCMTSMGVPNCQGCEECKTTYSFHPDYHEELAPHDWIEKFNSDTGKPYKMCNRCGNRDKESYKLSQVK